MLIKKGENQQKKYFKAKKGSILTNLMFFKNFCLPVGQTTFIKTLRNSGIRINIKLDMV